MTVKVINQLVIKLLIKKGDIVPIKRNWYYNFLHRHPKLRTHHLRTLNQACYNTIDQKTLKYQFNLYNTQKLLYSVTNNDTYNIDKKGYIKGVSDTSTVIVPREEAELFLNQPGNYKWVFIIKAISVNGFLLLAFVIFKGIRI